MKRVLRTTLTTLLVLALCLSLAPAAFAATNSSYDSLSGSDWMPVTVNVNGTDIKYGSQITFTVTALNGAPLPSDKAVQTFTLKNGVNELDLGFPITQMGVYEYEVVVTKCSYSVDQAYFRYVVYSLASGVESEVACYNADGDKCEPQININITQLMVQKKWVDNQSARPEYIFVDLMIKGSEDALETIKIDTTVNKGYFTGLDAAYEYEVKEHKNPSYAASYSYADRVVTITNTGSLYQTGQLNWPIPVLAAAGMILVAIGYMMLRKKEEKNA